MTPVKKDPAFNITNDFVFSEVFSDEGITRKFLESLLGVKIKALKYLIPQKEERYHAELKSFRFDIFVTDEDGNAADIEMQNSSRKEIVHRAYAYGSKLYLNGIAKGAPYVSTNRKAVIFLCQFDPFGDHKKLYHCGSWNFTTNRPMMTGAVDYYFTYSGGTEGDVPVVISDFLKYSKGAEPQTELVKDINNKVNELWNDEEARKIFMTLENLIYDNREDAHAEGKAEGFAEGKAKGIIEGKAKGFAEGKAKGIVEGKAEGIAEGKAKGIAEGKAKGIAEGKAKGIEEATAKYVYRMSTKGMSAEEIADMFDLPLDEVKSILARKA